VRIGFVRHAEPHAMRLERGGLNPGLTRRGIKQAMSLGKSGKLAGFKKMYVSPAQRTFETGLILCGYADLAPTPVNDLTFVRLDRKLIGDLATAIQNTPFDKWPELWFQTKWAGLENPAVYLERVRSALQEMIRTASGDNFLVIGHEETFWGIKAVIENISLKKAAEKRLGHAELYMFEIKGNI